MTVSVLKTEEEGAWTAFIDASSQTTIYHTIEWRQVASVFGHRPYYLVARNPSGAVEGVLPLFLVRGLFGKRLVSVPLRDRGGPLFTTDAALDELLRAAQRLTQDLSAKYLEIKTLDGLPGAVARRGFEKIEHYTTTVIELSSDAEAVWQRFDRVSVRQAISKGKRKGAVARWGEDLADVHKFYTLFLRTRKKLGVPPYPLALFEAIWTVMGQSDMAKLLLVEHDGFPIGGLIVFCHKDRAIAAYMASHEKYLDMNPNNLLFWGAIEWACQNGYRHFDFGASSPYQTSLIAFKSRWGGTEHKLPFYFFLNRARDVPVLDSNGPGYRLFRKMWARVPIPLARAAGPLLTKQMD